jgi:ionotropic glutamate receptor NMDA 1
VLLNGATGKVAFDNNGDRIYAEYDIINVKEVNVKHPVGQYYFNHVRKRSIIFLDPK